MVKTDNNGNVCSRCGKQRIAVSTYDEIVGNSSITYTVTACSDPECQKMVDQNLLKEEKKREVFKDEQEKRAALKKQEFENSKRNA